MKYMIITAALIVVAVVGCAKRPGPPLPTDSLPRLGDTKTQVDHLLSGRRAEGDAVAYELHLVNQFVRVSVLYSKYSDGTVRVMEVNLRNRSGISDEALREAKKQLLPVDSRVLKQRDVGEVVLNDAQGLSQSEDMAFLESKRLARRLVSTKYYHRAWYTGRCPGTSPGIIEKYTSRSDNGLERIGFFAPYLDKCQEKVVFDVVR